MAHNNWPGLYPFKIAYVGVVSVVAELHPGVVNIDNIGIDENRQQSSHFYRLITQNGEKLTKENLLA